MPEPIARWNPARSAWETDEVSLCGHSDVFSETWPSSGTTLHGSAYELPTWEHHTAATASSSPLGLLPTRRATDGEKGGPNQRDGSGSLHLTGIATRLVPQTTPDGPDGSPPEARPQLNPDFVEALMGFPVGYTDLIAWIDSAPLETPSSRNKQS